MRQLHRGEAFVTASGAVERPLGITRTKLKFNLGNGPDKPCVVEMAVTVVDTVAYDVLLGMEFIRQGELLLLHGAVYISSYGCWWTSTLLYDQRTLSRCHTTSRGLRLLCRPDKQRKRHAGGTGWL